MRPYVICVAILPWLSGILHAQQGTFGFGGSFPGIPVDDLNGDGKRDLVVPHVDANSVSVLLSHGPGFKEAPGSPFATGSGGSDVATGDFNNNEHLDLAITNRVTLSAGSGFKVLSDIFLLLDDGQGNLTASPGSPFPIESPYGSLLNSVATIPVDLNGDGNLDLVLASNSIWVLLGDGRGGFTKISSSMTSLSGPWMSITVADFNSDGKPDVAAVNDNGIYNSVFFGDGTGGFSGTFQFLTNVGGFSLRPRYLAAVDLDSDGKAELLGTSLAFKSIFAWKIGAAGSLPSPPGPVFSPAAGNFGTGDFNGDGHPDLAVLSSESSISVAFGDGRGKFTEAPGSPFQIGKNTNFIRAGDFNGDGKLDLIASSSYGFTAWLNGTESVDQLWSKNSASFLSSAIFAPGMIVYAEAPRIAPELVVATTNPWPTTLGGVRLEITDSLGTTQLAPIYYVSADAMSYLIPAALSAGHATLKLITADG